MIITFLGTGTSQGVPVIACSCDACRSENPYDKRLRTSIMVESDSTRIVIDAGPDFRQQMLREGVQDIDAVVCTHQHKDHIAGLDDVRPFNFIHDKDMPVFASEVVQEIIKKDYDYIFAESPYPGVPKVQLHKIDKKQIFTIGDLELQPIEVMHASMPVLGFRIQDFTYITDAKTIAPEELEKVKGTKTLVLNALQQKKHYSHLTLSEALELVEIIQPQQAFFTHISHKMGPISDIERELPDGVDIAHDGLKIKL